MRTSLLARHLGPATLRRVLPFRLPPNLRPLSAALPRLDRPKRARRIHNAQRNERPPFRLHVEDSPGVVAVLTGRGDRPTNEDRWITKLVRIPDPSKPSALLDIYFFAVFDGHGGDACSQFLKDNLHSNFQAAKLDSLESTLSDLSELYSRPAKGPADAHTWKDPLTVPQRLEVAFAATELAYLRTNPKDTCGSTATVACVQAVHFESSNSNSFEVTVAQVGDSRLVLGAGRKGIAHPLTTSHVPTVKEEQERIVEMGGFSTPLPNSSHQLVLGGLAVSRCFGDLKYKKFGGVIVDPQVERQRIDETHQAGFLCLITDGVCGVAHDQEIVDVIKQSRSPTEACGKVLELAEALGSTDNKTVIVVRLPGWSEEPTTNDLTKETRAKRIAARSTARRT